MKKVAVIMGSDSDWPIVKGACQQLAAKLDDARVEMAQQIASKEAGLQNELAAL